MLTEVHIKNFKSLKDNRVSLKNLNLLAGLNGMGKSSFIQVLLLLKQSPNIFMAGSIFKLTLAGELTKLGKGKDVFYEFASDEKIELALKTEKTLVNLSFLYNPSLDLIVLKQDKAIASSLSEVYKNFDKFQYISADRLGPREIHETSSFFMGNDDLGARGEYTAHFLHLFGNKHKVDEMLRHKDTESPMLLNQVNGWLGEISPGVKLNVIEVPHIDKLVLNYQFDLHTGRTTSYKPSNVGFGLSYVLPILVSLLTANQDKMIIIENPESHIHPRGQAELGKLMALAAEKGAQLFIETHSDHIINGIRVAVKERNISRKKVNICYFDKVTTDREQYTRIQELKLDSQGEISEYPENFLDEWNNQLLRLL